MIIESFKLKKIEYSVNLHIAIVLLKGHCFFKMLFSKVTCVATFLLK